ncbi:MAG: hypothetical protein KZQ77_11960 [Candidatus Thiodiazotropha sp. (ex Notomyrtea botanica)]|nr:hypothetical protein [Candidatus Thiodiazotropha sp. (ex Notomyrtea botanica)]
MEDSPETPDPTGLSAVMNLLKTPDIFRDMSGIEELGPMLQKLAEVAGAVEQQRLKEQGATEREKIKAKKDKEDEGSTSTGTAAAPGATTGIRGRNGSRSDGGDSGNAPTESPSTSARRVQREAAAFRDILNQGIDNDLLDSSQARDLYQRYAQNAVGDGTSDTVSDAVTGGWWQTAAPASYEPFRVQVPFRSRYTDFRRQVVLESSEIRRGMIFRSNQEFAEQVIDRTPDLSRLHAGLLAAEGMADGAPINLWGVIIRDSRRYVMTFHFQMEILFFEGDVVEGTTLDAVFVAFIAALRDALTRITYDNALHREELHCIVDQIDNQRSAAIENLRFIKNLGTSYGDLGINWFFHHAQPWQRAMVAASGFPPGDAMGRINPVNELYTEFISTDDADARASRLASRLNWIWQDIENGISGMALRNNEGTGNIMDANEQRFYDWFINQARHNPDSIYHCFNDRVLSFWPLVD